MCPALGIRQLPTGYISLLTTAASAGSKPPLLMHTHTLSLSESLSLTLPLLHGGPASRRHRSVHPGRGWLASSPRPRQACSKNIYTISLFHSTSRAPVGRPGSPHNASNATHLKS